MEADRRMDRDEAADLAALFEPRDHLWQGVSASASLELARKISRRRQGLNRASRGQYSPGSRIMKGNAPVWWRLAGHLIFSPNPRRGSPRLRLAVIQEIIFDDVRLISKAKYEVPVTVLM